MTQVSTPYDARNLAWLRTEALVFVPAMVVGMLVAQHAFGADQPE